MTTLERAAASVHARILDGLVGPVRHHEARIFAWICERYEEQIEAEAERCDFEGGPGRAALDGRGRP